MASLYTGLNTARSGLMASQTALDVTSQNISNANTPGYTRQTLNMTSMGPNMGGYRLEYNIDQVGNGVNYSGTTQIRDTFLDVRYRNSNSEYSDWQGQSDGFSSIEQIFNEFTSTSSDDAVGLSGQMTNLLTALQNYQNTPTDQTLPKTIETAVSNIAFMIRNDSQSLNTLDTEEKSDLTQTVTGSSSNGGINSILDNIQSLNKQIANYEITGHQADDLRDQRNQLLDTLSGELDVTVSEQSNGMVTVGLANDKTGNMLISADNTVTDLKVATNASGQTEVDWDDASSTPATINGGSVDAYLQVINGDGAGSTADHPYGSQGIAYFKKKLNDFAVSFDQLLNSFANSKQTVTPPATAAAYPSSGNLDPSSTPDTADTALVHYDPSDPAGTIDVSDKWKQDAGLFAENATDATTGTQTNMGDYISQLISQLNQSSSSYSIAVPDPANPPSGQKLQQSGYPGSVFQFADSFTGDIAQTVSHVSGMADSTKNIVSNLDNQRQSISSVSIDEEGINIIKFQQAYSASARVISVINDMLGTLISSMGTT